MLRGRHHGVLTRGGSFATRGGCCPAKAVARGRPPGQLTRGRRTCREGRKPTCKEKKGQRETRGPSSPSFPYPGTTGAACTAPFSPGGKGNSPLSPPGAGRGGPVAAGWPPGEGSSGAPRPTRPTLPPKRPSRAPTSVHSYVRVPLCRPSVSAEETPRAPALLRDARPPFARPFAGGGSGAGNRSRASRGARPSACPRRGDLLPRGAAPAKPPAMCLPPRGVSSPGRRAPRGGTPARIMCVPGDATVWTWKFPGRLPGLCPRIPGAPGRSRAGSVALGAPSPDETPSPRVGLTRG